MYRAYYYFELSFSILLSMSLPRTLVSKISIKPSSRYSVAIRFSRLSVKLLHAIVFFAWYQSASVAIAWSSKKQPIVALMIIEAKYRGAAVVACEAVWLKSLLKDLQVEVFDLMTIYCDNLKGIQLAWNPVFHARTKHIDVHYYFVHEHVLSNEAKLVYVPTDRQTADIFTKPLGLDNCCNSQVRLGCNTSTY